MVNKNWRLQVLTFFILLFISSLSTFAQDDIKDMFLEAESYFLFEEYNEALPLYTKILRKNPYNDNINYRIGMCYLHHDYKKDLSIKYLEKAIKNISPNYKEGSYKETKAPVDAMFYLGDAYRVNNKMDLAIKYFKKFLSIVDEDVYDTELVKKKIETCENAKVLEKRPVDYISVNMGDTINSRFAEFNAVISADGKTLAFTRSLQFYDGIFVSYLNDGHWTNPKNIITQLGVDGDIVTCSLDKTGNELFLYRSDEYDGNLYHSLKNGPNWSKIEKLNKNINTKYWESHASISSDGNTLYFTSNRKGGYGGLDIYKSEKDNDGDWGPATNLGSNINTDYNEDAPFISENGNILFFTSDGHVSIGGYDIFYSEKKGGSWTVPDNFGYPINTPDDNLFFAPFTNGKYALVSIFDESTRGLKDIVKLEIFWKLNPKPSDGIVSNEVSENLHTNIFDKPDENIKTNIPNSDNIANEPVKKQIDAKNPLNSKIDEAFTEKSSLDKGKENKDFNTSSEFSQGVDNKGTLTEKLPLLEVESENIDVTTGEEINLNIKLQKNSTLVVKTYNNGKLIKTQTFEIKNENFLLPFKPLEGENNLILEITDENSLKNQKTITINYISDPPQNLLTKDNLKAKDINAMFDNIYSSSGNEIRKSLDDYKAVHSAITLAGLMKHLFENSSNYRYDPNDVISMLLTVANIRNENLQDFFNKVIAASGNNLQGFLKSAKLDEYNIKTPAALLKYIFDRESYEKYTMDDIYSMLAKILADSYYTDNSKVKTGHRDLTQIKQNRNNVIIYILGFAILIIIFAWIIFRIKAKNKKEQL